MGQIVSAAAKPKRCNLNKLSQLEIPVTGEHILVSSDNSMNDAGQGNFDCYIVGDGTTAATELPLNSIASETIQPTHNGVSGMAFFSPSLQTIQPTKIHDYFYNIKTQQLVNNIAYWYCIQEIPEMASKLNTRWEKSTAGGIGIEFRDLNGNVVGTYSNTTQDAGSEIEIDIPHSAVVFTYSYQKSMTFDGFEFTILKSIFDDIDVDADFSYSSENPIQNKIITETLFGEPFFELTGFGTDGTVAGVTQVGEVYYNTDSKLLRKCVIVGQQFETIPFNDGIYKNRQNGLFYKWNGTDMVEAPPRNGGINEKLADVEDKINNIENTVFGSNAGSIVITDIPKNDGYYYNLHTKSTVANANYFTSEVDIPYGASSLEMRFEKSTAGGIGVEFRDTNGSAIGVYSNITEPIGTKIRVDIHSNTKSIIFSYLNEAGCILQGAEAFDGITFYFSGGIVEKVESLELQIKTVTAGADFYLSSDTGNTLQDDLTLEELYAGYDKLCINYPNYIKRLNDIGTDSAGNEIRQYRVGYNKQFYQIGEGMYPDKQAENLWNDSLAYNKILVNTGTHGDEKAPCYATMLAFKDLVESSEPWAMRIKSNVTIYVCPTLNPYGFQNRTLANANGVNINRDIANQTQPESQAWKAWIDKNIDAIAYLDMHGVDFYTPFFEISKNEDSANIKKYAHLAFRLSSYLKDNWDKTFVVKGWARPYLLKSTYEGTTTDYTSSVGIQGFIVETPCDVVNNQYNEAPNYFKSYSKSNKMTKDMLINILDFLASNKGF